MTATTDYGQLWDFRRRVDTIYRQTRDSGTSESSWKVWRDERDALFRRHPQSPIPSQDRSAFAGLPFSPYEAKWNLSGRLDPLEPVRIGVVHSGEGSTPMTRFARISVDSPKGPLTLDVYWMNVYGGGVFIPFRDSTNGTLTYGGGRYLLDTAKSADLGDRDGEVALDFNFAYHPSCTHDPRWSCPLAPPSNTLDFAVPVGEQMR
ncbi:MAG: DUF1684 domain-containing protein [Acidimicrobiia bacterium]|nr:MAG: DUF1684 domain-containing protein [Acidimicrobiia bacterium]